MNCEVHPNADGIGRCVSCGRVVCQACAVRVGDIIHCKECVEAGKVQGPPRPQAPAVAGPPGPYPYGPMGAMMYIPPNPTGPPDPRLFRDGALGSLLCLISIMPWIIIDLASYGFHGAWRYSDAINYVFFVFNFITLGALMLFARGFLGFYRNYGEPRARTAASVLVGAAVINIAIEVFFMIVVLTDWYYSSSYPYWLSPFSIVSLLADISLALAYLFTYLSLGAVKLHLPPGSQTRDHASLASFIFLIICIWLFIPVFLIYRYIEIPPIGGILEVVAFFLMWRVFLTAPQPAPPQPPWNIPPPGPEVAGRTPGR